MHLFYHKKIRRLRRPRIADLQLLGFDNQMFSKKSILQAIF